MRFMSVVVVLVAVTAAEGIRVYEGTNFARPGGANDTWKAVPAKRAEPRSDHPRTPARGNQLLKFSKELKPTPNLYKVKLTQKGYLQFLRYLADVPPLREYTFCLWFASNNLSHAQPLFSYAVQDKQRLLAFWYEPKDATIRKSIREDLVYKVPALIAENEWHHVCESWNGVRGEWILFFDGSKVGSGQLHKYKGTYVPGGGEVVVGQEPSDFHKGLDDGIEGEIFGFNLVDEAVKDDIIIRKNRVTPDTELEMTKSYVPPFKSLPPMKKSYQEIKAFIKSLPNGPNRYVARSGSKPKPGGVQPNKPHLKTKIRKTPQRGNRNKQRPHYKPVKAVIYEREDRRLQLDDRKLTKKLGELAPEWEEEERISPDVNQIYNENYSIHSYRIPKEKPKGGTSYEIYEDTEEEVEEKTGQRKARMNFNILTAREANTLYAMSKSDRQRATPTYHFQKQTVGRRSFDVMGPEKVESSASRKDTAEGPKVPPEFIPVREEAEDVPSSRRKRDVGEHGPETRWQSQTTTHDELTKNFRPMPKMPDGFINIFARPEGRTEMDWKLDRFFPNGTKENTRKTAPATATPEEDTLAVRNDVFDSPVKVQIRRNLIVTAKDLERRPGITAGTELVRRSYEDCAAERGSPVKDKDRFVISWADTPVRIYGGAVVTTAFNICGHF